MKKALIGSTELQQDRIESGDVAVILKRDGTFRVVQCYDDGEIDPGCMTTRQTEQGTALLAFAFMLREPEIMGIVAGMASDHPAVNVERMH